MEKSLYNDENLLLSLLLRELRVDAGISQTELAERLHGYKTFVSKYELGERRLDVVEVRHICEALGKGFMEFMAYYDNECKDLPRSLVRDKKLRSRL